MTDQIEKLTTIIDHVRSIQAQLNQLLRHLQRVKKEVEAKRSPPTTVAVPADFAEETPHFGTMI
jgi:hypothetical protein